VLLLALVVLAAWSATFKVDELHVVRHNDQVGYVTTARWLAETGELRSHLIYPAYADEPSWRLYMPGTYVGIALATELFGNTPLVWRLPGMIAYALAAVGVFVAARRLYGDAAGWIAAILFLAFPPNLVHAYMVMAEMPLSAAAILAFAAFLFLPARFALPALPLLLLVPFLYRETGALVVIPAVLVALGRLERGRRRALALTVVAAIVVLGLAYVWQSASGRDGIPSSWILTGRANYTDAVARAHPPELSLGGWWTAVGDNFARNVALLERRFRYDLPGDWKIGYVGAILVLSAAAVGIGLLRVRRDLFPLGAGLLGAALALLLCATYTTRHYIALRNLLMAWPFLAVAAGGALRGLVRALSRAPSPNRRRGPRLAAGAIVLVCLGSIAWVHIAGMLRMTALIETIGHDDNTVLVCDPPTSLDYALKHFPVRSSFVPANDETLRLLCEHHDVGTLILPEDALRKSLRRSTLMELGFREDGAFARGFTLFRRAH